MESAIWETGIVMIEPIVLAVLVVAGLVLFFQPVMKRINIIKAMKGELNFDRTGDRISRWIGEVIFQNKVISQRPYAGLMHALVFWGFLAFMLATLDHFCRGFGLALLGNGSFFHGFSRVVSVFAVVVIIGITALLIRRFVTRPACLGDHLSYESGLIALFIEGLMITYLLAVFGGLEIVTLGDESTGVGAQINWWIHSLFILSFLSVIPRSKHLHLVLGLGTTFLKDFRLAPLTHLDIENDEFGAENLNDLGPFTALSAFTCVECGRCFDHCPAAQSGKTLNPKQLILDIKAGLLDNTEKPIIKETLTEEVIWQCTTCGACTFQCPVGVEHVSPIIDTRRGLVAEGSFPAPMKNLFKSLERQRNPWGYPPTQAQEFLEENSFPIYEKQDVLYWMGSFARLDELYKKISLAFVEKLNEAGVSWGVLPDEASSGDAARRAGNEFLFLELAMENIELLNAASPKTIVTTCPHTLRTLQEYQLLPEDPLNPDIRILHHSTYLKELGKQGKFKSAKEENGAVTYHDACYLSRYTTFGVEDPRAYLQQRGVKIVEPERKGLQSFCCGAGGGQFYNEETEGERINHVRTKELLKTGAKTIVTACPYCRAMIHDCLKDLGKEEEVVVKDLAQM